MGMGQSTISLSYGAAPYQDLREPEGSVSVRGWACGRLSGCQRKA